ncbi:hypothetical protein ACFPWS_43810 [Streptomyces aureus]|uniref:hypothetical protein n=1 Tax=Streptomyces aureus TaxID=193461 RepID=UPI0031DF997C
MLLTRPDNLKTEQHELLAKLIAACPEMTPLAAAIPAGQGVIAFQHFLERRLPVLACGEDLAALFVYSGGRRDGAAFGLPRSRDRQLEDQRTRHKPDAEQAAPHG